MKTNKGFTLIELLVVIAIIGILSSVVLASLTTARSKGSDAALQSELSNMRAQAELFYSSNGNYGTTGGPTLAACTASTLFTDATVGLKTLVADVISKTSSKVLCNATSTSGSATAWAVQASTSGGTWCVDSNGKSTSTSITTTGLCI